MRIFAKISADNGKNLSDVLLNITENFAGDSNKKAEQANTFGSWISKTLTKGAIKFSDYLGDGAANSFMAKSKDKITAIINNYMYKNGVFIEVAVEQLVKSNEMLFCYLNTVKIDYKNLAEKFLPLLQDLLNKNMPDGIATGIFAIIDKELNNVSNAVLENISDDKKEKIIKFLIERYNKTICNKVTEKLKEKGIEIKVSHIEII